MIKTYQQCVNNAKRQIKLYTNKIIFKGSYSVKRAKKSPISQLDFHLKFEDVISRYHSLCYQLQLASFEMKYKYYLSFQ